MKAEDLKLIVKEKYSEIANQSKGQNAASCCGAETLLFDCSQKLSPPHADVVPHGTPREYERLRSPRLRPAPLCGRRFEPQCLWSWPGI